MIIKTLKVGMGFLAALIALFPCQALSQEISCGTVSNIELVKNSLSSRTARQLDIADNEGFFPLTRLALNIHVFRDSDGQGGVSEEYLYNEIADVNHIYSASGIQFYIDQLDYVNSTQLYDFDVTEEDQMADARDLPDAINIYYVGSIRFLVGTACGYAYLPNQGPSRIIMSQACGLEGNTLAHEIGHFFNLIHTHGDSNSYNSTDELVDGSNCGVSGDLICDTPADPLLTNQVNNACEYIGTFLDAKNQAYDPDTRNLMSYSRGSCRDSFTLGQIERIRNSYVNDRSYLKAFPVQANFIADQRKVCQFDEIIFTDLSVGARSWNWTFEGGQPLQSNERNPIVSFDQPGEYQVTLSVSGDEGDDELIFSDYVIVRPTPDPNVDINESFEEYVNINQIETESDGLFLFGINNEYSLHGNKSVWLSSFSSFPGTVNTSRFYTIAVTENLNSDFLLQFDYAYKKREGYSDRLSISVETFCGREPDQIYSQSQDNLSKGLFSEQEFVPQLDDWFQEGVVFSPEVDEEPFNLAFTASFEGGNNLFVDNIRVRPLKSIDEDSMILVQIYEALGGNLSWDMRANVKDWLGVKLSDQDKVISLNFEGLNINRGLPSGLASLTDLDTLVLDYNSFYDLHILNQLSGLSCLSLVDNGLTDLPDNWSNMSSLRKLDLRNNKLSSLPSSLLELEGLEIINGRNNQIRIENVQSTSSTLKLLDLSANNLTQTPNFTSGNSALSLNVSQNDIAVLDMTASYRQKNIYTPQNLVGATVYIQPTQPTDLACPLPTNSTNSQLKWYRNNELLSENEDILTVTDISPAYYQCQLASTEIPGIKRSSRPILINNPRSICEYNLSGVYTVSSTYAFGESIIQDIETDLTITAIDNHLYEISDLSFGVESQFYNQPKVLEQVSFDCGELFTPIGLSHSYHVTSTEVDVSTGQVIINWINAKGGKGTSELIRTQRGLSNEADFLSFKFNSQSALESIDLFNRTVEVRVGCKEFSNIPSFELSQGALAYVDGELQESAVSSQDFNQPVAYMVIAEDGVTTYEWTVTLLEEPSVVDVSFSIIDQTFCEPLNGHIKIDDITVDGISKVDDVQEFEIIWADDPDISNPIGTELELGNLVADTYSLRVAEISSGCGIELTSIAVADMTPDPILSIEATEVDKSCGGIHTGEISTSIQGLTSPTAVSWEIRQNDSWVNLDQYKGLEVIEAVQSGTYRQTINDLVSGCQFIQEVNVVSQPSVVEVAVSIMPETDCSDPNGSLQITSVIQDGLNLGLSGDNFLIEWYDSPNLEFVIGTNYVLDNLTSGNYYLKVTESALLCESRTYSFFVPSSTLSGDLGVDSKQNNTLCSAFERNGTISVSVDQSTEGFSFDWYSGTGVESSPIHTGASISQISGGTYTVVATSTTGSEKGCYSSLTTSIIDDIDELSLTLTSTPTTNCESPNGTVEVEKFTVDGQEVPIRGIYEIEWSTNLFFGSILSTRESLSNLPEMEYFARVTNAVTGCETGTVSVRVESEFPTIEASLLIQSNTNCQKPFNGQIELEGLEPLSDYGFSWYDQNIESKEEPISTETELSNLYSGEYFLAIKHLESGCTKDFIAQVGEKSAIPEVKVRVNDQTNCALPNGSLGIAEVIEGGVSRYITDYRIEWSETEDFSSETWITSELTDLAANDYYVKVFNPLSGCKTEALKYTVRSDTMEPIISLVNINSEKPAFDESGEIEINVEYSGAYTIGWYNAEDLTSTIGSELVLDGLQSGSYTVLVNSDMGCTTSTEFEIPLDSRKLQSIEFDLPSEVFVDTESIILTATSSSGQEVRFGLKSGPGRVLLGELDVLGTGEIELIAEVEANDEYFAASTTFKITVKPLLSISGLVIGGASSGQVSLYGGQWQQVAVTSFSAGEYAIDDLEPGYYYLEVSPSSIIDSQDLITYYPNVYSWQESVLLEVVEDMIINVELISAPTNDVGSSVEGIVGHIDGNTLFTIGELKEVSEPVRGTKVYLIDQSSGMVEAAGVTSFDGSVSFDLIPTGNYHLFFNEIGNELDLSSVVLSIDDNSKENTFTLEIGDTDQINLVVISGIDEWSGGELTLYPNPTDNQVNLGFESRLIDVVSLRTYNLTGALMETQEILPGISNHALDLSTYPSGTYLIHLTDHQGSLIKRVIRR